jgi:hypothetical protein
MAKIIVPCLYCGKPVLNVKKGEHIFPEAIGGVLAIKNVCGKCNNGVLSALDDELVSRSQLGMIASAELGTKFHYCWDVDHSANDLLMEAEPIFDKTGLVNMTLWPQLILEGNDLQLRASSSEVLQYGKEEFARNLFAHAKRCFDRWRNPQDKKDRKALAFERIPPGIAGWRNYRLPPRIFAKRRMSEYTPNKSMTIRYVTEDDKRRLLNKLEKITAYLNFKNQSMFHLEERTPQISREWQPAVITRALTKIGINLLSHLCEKTPVNLFTFVEPVPFVLGELALDVRVYSRWGFVWPNDLAEIHRYDNGHAARVVYDTSKRMWIFYISFFGGKMAAMVEIPGPNTEDWLTADVSTPLSSKTVDVTKLWVEKKSKEFKPFDVHVEWADPIKTCPSIEFLTHAPNLYHRLPIRYEERH